MKAEGEIRQKLKQAKYRHMKRSLEDRFLPGEKWDQDLVDEAKEEFKKLFELPLHIVAQKYPDVAALMWVLEEITQESLVINGTLVGTMDGVMLWADSEGEAEHARRLLDALAETASVKPQASWWKGWFR